MSGYSIIILICQLSISHADCQLNTALDVVRGPRVDNPVMCGLKAQTMIARTDLIQGGSQYVKILCAPNKNTEEWTAEIEARKRGGNPSLRPRLVDGQIRFVYFAGAGDIPEASLPDINNKSHTIRAYVDQPGEGVLVAAGGVQGGYSLFVKDGKPTYEYNWLGQDRYRVVSSQVLPPNKSEITVRFNHDGGGAAKGGYVTMFVDSKPVAEGRVERTSVTDGSFEKTFDVGFDSGSPVSNQYAAPFKFTGIIDRIEVTLETKE